MADHWPENKQTKKLTERETSQPHAFIKSPAPDHGPQIAASNRCKHTGGSNLHNAVTGMGAAQSLLTGTEKHVASCCHFHKKRR